MKQKALIPFYFTGRKKDDMIGSENHKDFLEVWMNSSPNMGYCLYILRSNTQYYWNKELNKQFAKPIIYMKKSELSNTEQTIWKGAITKCIEDDLVRAVPRKRFQYMINPYLIVPQIPQHEEFLLKWESLDPNNQTDDDNDDELDNYEPSDDVVQQVR